MQDTIKRNTPLPLCETNPLGSLKLQVIFRKRATNCRALLRKMTHEDRTSYDSTPPCKSMQDTIKKQTDILMKQTDILMCLCLCDVFSNVAIGSDKEEYTPPFMWNNHFMCTEIFLCVCVCTTSSAASTQDPIKKTIDVYRMIFWQQRIHIMCTTKLLTHGHH